MLKSFWVALNIKYAIKNLLAVAVINDLSSFLIHLWFCYIFNFRFNFFSVPKTYFLKLFTISSKPQQQQKNIILLLKKSDLIHCSWSLIFWGAFWVVDFDFVCHSAGCQSRINSIDGIGTIGTIWTVEAETCSYGSRERAQQRGETGRLHFLVSVHVGLDAALEHFPDVELRESRALDVLDCVDALFELFALARRHELAAMVVGRRGGRGGRRRWRRRRRRGERRLLIQQ